ncbi:MAG: hypothetical protein HC831_06850 [Chloroflexia bacterium]|nr:hypothetical protein [Chloroflexia bacterium]
MLYIKHITLLLGTSFYLCLGYSQTIDDLVSKERYLRIMFYNTENLFDTENDSLTTDEEFLPNGPKFWTSNKYYTKLNQIATTIVSIGGWTSPEIIGLCEVENRKVLDDLCKKTGLKNLNYRIIHKESPDNRGIDVALLYQKDSFKPLGYKAIQVTFPFSPGSTTRDILYVKGLTKNEDTLHLFVNHWPSRWGGQLESESRRMEAAKTLKTQTDSIFNNYQNAKIVIIGDFNDYPDNKSIKQILKASNNFENFVNYELYNLSAFIEQMQILAVTNKKGIGEC